MTNEIPKELITSALELCGKRMKDMEERITGWKKITISLNNPLQ